MEESERDRLEALLEAITLAGSADLVREEVQELQRLAVCAMMYKNLGRLMEKFSDTPVRVEDFYDMNYIRDGAAAPPEDVPPPVPPPVP